jgi:hypothetical protein
MTTDTNRTAGPPPHIIRFMVRNNRWLAEVAIDRHADIQRAAKYLAIADKWAAMETDDDPKPVAEPSVHRLVTLAGDFFDHGSYLRAAALLREAATLCERLGGRPVGTIND